MNRTLGAAGPMLSVLLCLALPGCGPATGTVKGKVLFNGKPLPCGVVTFFAGDHRISRADIRADGTFFMDKAPVGPVTVMVWTPPNPPSPMRPKALEGFQNDVVISIPASFDDPEQSGLRYTVVKGFQEHDVAFEGKERKPAKPVILYAPGIGLDPTKKKTK